MVRFLHEPLGHMAELVDALDLGSSGEIRGGSSPFMPTILHCRTIFVRFFIVTLAFGWPELMIIKNG